MAAGVALLVAAVVLVHGAHTTVIEDNGVPPKFVKAAFGVQKALYAKQFGYSLKPIPQFVQKQAHPPASLPLVGEIPVVSSRQGRAYKYYRPRGPPNIRRRKKRPFSKRRRPSSYGVPVYATKYKNYVPSRRPRPSYSRYKKKRRPYRGPLRRPPPYREIPHDFDEYEQEIPDDYEDYEGDRGDYSYFDIPQKRLPLQYDKEFLNRHADLYNSGYNPGLPRGRPKDSAGQYSQLRTRVRYPVSNEDTSAEQTSDKQEEESQENLWPGEVSNVHSHESHHHWHDREASSNVRPQTPHWHEDDHSASLKSWHDEVHSPPSKSWHDEVNNSPHLTSWHDHTQAEWANHPRPPRQDNQWQVYQPQQNPQSQLTHNQHQQQVQWPPRPTPAPEVRGWTTSLRPKPLSAAVAVPSRPVVPREQEPHNHRPVYNWDPVSQSYQEVAHDTRPRYQSHYSEAEFNHNQYHNQVDRKSESRRSHRSSRTSEPDIGFGEGMEVVDDGVAGWKVKK